MKIIPVDGMPREGVSHDPAISKQVLLRSGDVPHLTAFSRATLAPGQTAHAHQHLDMFEVFYVESGAGLVTIANTAHRLSAGVCILVEPGELHEITNDSSRDLVLNYFGIAE